MKYTLGYTIPLETVHYMCLKRHLLQCTGDFWAKFNCEEILDIRLGAVDSNYGNKGLGREMLEANLSLGKVLGIKVNYVIIPFYQNLSIE